MSKERKYQQLFMDIAIRVSEMSYSDRLKVGSIIEKDGRIISIGWNGTPAGWDNCCEDREYMPVNCDFLTFSEINETWPYIDSTGCRYKLVTKPECLHAERNAIDKLAKSHESGLGSTMYCTHSPCLECSKSILGAGISTVIYKTDYRTTDGINFLLKSNIKIQKIG